MVVVVVVGRVVVVGIVLVVVVVGRVVVVVVVGIVVVGGVVVVVVAGVCTLPNVTPTRELWMMSTCCVPGVVTCQPEGTFSVTVYVPTCMQLDV